MFDYDALIESMEDDAFIQADVIVSRLPAVSKATSELEEWLDKQITDVDTYNETIDKVLAYEYNFSRAFFSMGIKTGIRLASNITNTEGSAKHGC